MYTFEENTPYASFLLDNDDEDILVEDSGIDESEEDMLLPNDLEEDFPEFMDNDWSWLQ